MATHCALGHKLSGTNLYLRADGKRRCRECHKVQRNASEKRVRERNIAAGLCADCGKEREDKTKKLCARCRARICQVQARRAARLKGIAP